MIELTLVGIGSGNPEHLTLQAVRALNEADLILIPEKGEGKSELAEVRREICANVLTHDATLQGFAMPTRDPKITDYDARVNDWHDRIADIWTETITAQLGNGTPAPTGKVAFLVWGDPSLYDSTLRIADRVKTRLPMTIRVIAGITSIQSLTAAHTIPVNEINGPFTITTGRQLRDHGFPQGVDTCVVMLDGDCSFMGLDPEGLTIWWTAYAGMDGEINRAGPLAEVRDDILRTHAKAREDRGWVMDIYMLRRAAPV